MQKVVRRVASVVVAVGLSAGLTALAVEPASATAKSAATVKEYSKIKNGQSASKVRQIIGGSGTRVQSEEFGPGEQVYIWQSTGGKNVYVGFRNGKVIGKSRENDRTVSSSEYRRLKKGISYARATSVIREKGEKVYSERKGGKLYVGYAWANDALTKTVAVLFINGKLADKDQLPIQG